MSNDLDAEIDAAAAADRSKPKKRNPGPNEMICSNPNCGFIGIPTKKNRGNPAVMVLLFLVGVLPGILYAILMSGYEYSCPRCHIVLKTERK